MAQVLELHFNETSGTNAPDTSPQSNDGTLENGTLWDSGGQGSTYCCDFDGTNDRVDVADDNSLDLGGNSGTIMMWVKPTSNWSSGYDTGVMKLNSGGTDNVYCLYIHDNQAAPGLWFAGQRYQGSTAATGGNWTHIAVTWDFNNVRFYIGGVLDVTRTQANDPATSTGEVQIGGNTAFGEYFDGLIEDVKIFDTTLSQSEIETERDDHSSGISQAIGLTTETDSSFAMTASLGAVTINVGQSTETDTAQSMTVSQAQVVSVNQASESDTSFDMTVSQTGPQTIQIGIASESDYSFSLTRIGGGKGGGWAANQRRRRQQIIEDDEVVASLVVAMLKRVA